MKQTIVVNSAYAQLGDFLRQLPVQFDTLGRIIHDGRNTVRTVSRDGLTLVVKRFKCPMWFQRVAYTWFRPTKARRAYEFALRFRNLGIDTPRPVAYVETREGGLFSRGYFVSEGDFRPSCVPFGNGSGLEGEAMIAALARQLCDLHRLGILHGDLNLSNILYEETDPGQWHFAFIDINRTRFVKGTVTKDMAAENLCWLTHNRPLLMQVCRAYARLRRWDEADFMRAVAHCLERRERWKDWLARFSSHKRRRRTVPQARGKVKS